MDYCALKAETTRLLERLHRAKAVTEFPAIAKQSGAGYTGPKKDRMEKAVIRKVELEERLQPMIENNYCRMVEIENEIWHLQDPMEREVLRLRYMDSEGFRPVRWTDVAIELYGDDDEAKLQAVYRLHRRALKHLEELNGG